MTKLNTLKALQKAEVLQMRGRGCCGYGDDDFDIDFGCFDWEVIWALCRFEWVAEAVATINIVYHIHKVADIRIPSGSPLGELHF